MLRHGLAYGHPRFRSRPALPAGTSTIHLGLNPTGLHYTPVPTGLWYSGGTCKLGRPGKSGDKEL